MTESPPADAYNRWKCPLLTDLDNADRASRRARQSVRWYVRHNDLRRILTLTNGDRDGWRSKRACLDDVSAYLKHDGRDLYGDVYVAIAEHGGKNRRVHAHLLVSASGRLDYARCIRSWSFFMESRGWHSESGTHRWHAGDPDDRRVAKDRASSARVAAKYAVKYVGKEIEIGDRNGGEHRYRRSLGHASERHVTIFESLRDALEWLDTLDTASFLPFVVDDTGEIRGFWADG